MIAVKEMYDSDSSWEMVGPWETQSTPATGDANNDSSSDDWEILSNCDECVSASGGREESCDAESKAPAANATTAKPKSWAALFGEVQKLAWACQICTLNNEGVNLRCTACDAPKQDTVVDGWFVPIPEKPKKARVPHDDKMDTTLDGEKGWFMTYKRKRLLWGPVGDHMPLAENYKLAAINKRGKRWATPREDKYAAAHGHSDDRYEPMAIPTSAWPPPEFPLASPLSHIVHHLKYKRTQPCCCPIHGVIETRNSKFKQVNLHRSPWFSDGLAWDPFSVNLDLLCGPRRSLGTISVNRHQRCTLRKKCLPRQQRCLHPLTSTTLSSLLCGHAGTSPVPAPVPVSTDEDGNTPLILAALNGDLEAVRDQLKAGSNPDQADDEGCTALIMAAQNDHLQVAQELLKAGADVAKSDDDGDTPLTIAAANGCLEIVQELLKAGSDPEQGNNEGCTPLILAVQNDCNLQIAQDLLQSGADVNKPDEDGDTPLIVAAINGHLEFVRMLRNASAEVEMANNDGHTALVAAANNGHLQIVQELTAAAPVDDDDDGIRGMRGSMNSTSRTCSTSPLRALLDIPIDGNVQRRWEETLARLGGNIRTPNGSYAFSTPLPLQNTIQRTDHHHQVES